ncbi:3975_t:CDS:1, partial [Dentiscutata erythropus]
LNSIRNLPMLLSTYLYTIPSTNFANTEFVILNESDNIVSVNVAVNKRAAHTNTKYTYISIDRMGKKVRNHKISFGERQFK